MTPDWLLATCDDPHHGGLYRWGYDGHQLWQKPLDGPWRRAERVKFTADRALELAKLVRKAKTQQRKAAKRRKLAA